ncbi:unnamed protein product [Sphagnum jensenii]|uniref:C3H1-type domain-containing protein n=1 Tax=Sphagnum jensenii TaxID=128206 RepID=A0ABP0WV20_9BRYO
MPPHKYYCDYCDKQFYDTPASRKRHLKGISHQRAKKQWFDSFKGSVECAEGEPLLNLDGERALCAEFMQTGVCRFRNHCNSFHPNWPLPVQFGVSAGEQVHSLTCLNSMDVAGNFSRPELAVASVLERNLPPSLCPPPDGGYHPPPWIDWG